jgi:hypothetical protein
MKRQRSIAGPVIIASLLAGWFGYWLGQRKAPPPAPPDGPIVTMLECPPAIGEPEPQPKSAAEPHHRTTVTATKPNGRELPTLAATDDHREQLLGYIRDRANLLQDCLPNGHERLRLTLRLDVGREGAINKVQVVDGDPNNVKTGECVADRMRAWTLPQQWVQARQALLMSVVL